jgi:hypothetical protein
MFALEMVAVSFLWAVASAQPQDSTEELRKENAELKRQFGELNQKVDTLNTKLELYETKQVPKGPAGVEPEVEMMPDGDNIVVTALKDTRLSGYVDTGYMLSFNHVNAAGHATNGPTNPVRVFDNKENSFYLHSIQLNVEKLATEKMIVGYHFELVAGHDPLTYDGSNVSLQEGWVQLLAPIGTGLDIRIGKQATLVGFEVIESMSDFNYSRSILFGQAENFTNTGLRLTYNFVDQFYMVLGFNNGPNAALLDGTFADNNHGKEVEIQAGIKPTKDILVTFTIETGTEDTASTNDKFYIFDIVASWNIGKFTVALNYDQDSKQVGGPPAAPPFDVAARFPVSGIAAYAKFQATDIFASSIRGEYYSDQKGSNLLLNPDPVKDGVGKGTGARVSEVTLTEEFKIASTLILRVEVRHDDSNQHVFSRDGKPSKSDNTLGFEAILPF